MAKLLARIFRSRSSSSSKRRSPHGSQLSIDDNSRYGGASSGMRPASSLENLTNYYVNPKELEKFKLHKASWEGNMNKVRTLAGPAQIDIKDQHSRTPLHLAVVQGHVEIVRYLVHEGAKLDTVDNEKRTPLLKAVLSCSRNPELTFQICRCIIEGGGDAFINAVDIHKRNALHYAVAFEQEELVDYFLSVRSCDPNFRDGNEMTPLHLAVDRKNPKIVDVLLSEQHEQQADPNLTARNGYTPLHMAALIGNQEIVHLLLKANLEEPCDPTILDSQQLTAFQLAQMNRHEQCAKLIEDYQKHWTTLRNSRRKTSAIIDEQAINHMTMDPSRHLDDDDEQTSQSTPSSETSSSSTPSSKPDRRPSNPLSDRTVSSVSAAKSEPRSLADIIKRNPLQPDVTKGNVPKTNDQALTSLVNNTPLQPLEAAQSKPVLTQQKPPSLSTFGITPAPSVHRETDYTSTSVSIEKSIIGANLLVGQTSISKKNVTTNALANAVPLTSPRDSTSNSWTHDSASAHEQKQIVQAKKVETWDADSISQSDDDNDTGVYHANLATTNFPKQQAFPGLNVPSMFVTTPRPDNTDDSRSDEDSIEAAIRQQNTQRPSSGIQSIVNKQIGNSYPLPQQSSIPLSPPSANDDSSWSEDSVAASKQATSKAVNALIHQQPLHSQQHNESALDDSRPLSADLKRQSVQSKSTTSTTSDDTDDEHNEKAATIVRSPFSNGAVGTLVQTTVRPTEPTESKPTGVENLSKIIDDIKHSSAANLKYSTSPKTISKLVVSPLLQRSDSLSSNASSLLNDTGANSMKQQFHHDDINTRHWSATTTNRYDYEHLARNNSNEMIQQSHRQLSRASIHHDLNNLRGSMSSSTSSIQNNMERISELKEDIKQIERKQEDSLELKRQLKEMEVKKNNFEALYKKNDQLLRETESKLEREIGEKQRLEWTTKNLNTELKNIRERLESLEDEKDILNQRCLKLKEERDNYDEKLRVHQTNTLQTAAAGVLREEDIEKIKSRHREEMKLLSAENDDLHQRTKQLQSDLQLHKESLDVTIRYKIDLEKALEEKLFLQRELDRLKHEKDFIEQEKTDYKTKYDNLQDEIRALILDRSRLEQKLTHELAEQTKQTQRSTDDSRKYKAQIEQLNLKLGDAEARLLVLQTRNEAMLAPKDREINSEFETLKQRLDLIESEKRHAEQRYHTERQEITSKQQLQQQQTPNNLQEPLMILTSSSSLGTGVQQQQQPPSFQQHSPSSTCMKCDTLQRNFEQEREQRLQTQRDNERLRDTVSRQEYVAQSFQQHQHSDQLIAESNNRIRSENERMKHEIDRLRQDFDKLITNYDPSKHVQPYSQQQPLVSQADALRQLYEQELREKQLLLSKLMEVTKPPQPLPPPATKATTTDYHRTASPVYSYHHHDYDHSFNEKSTCSICSNGRLLRERLENAIDTSLANQRIQTIKQIPILPRPMSAPLSTNTNGMSSVDILRKRYYV